MVALVLEHGITLVSCNLANLFLSIINVYISVAVVSYDKSNDLKLHMWKKVCHIAEVSQYLLIETLQQISNSREEALGQTAEVLLWPLCPFVRQKAFASEYELHSLRLVLVLIKFKYWIKDELRRK